MFGKSAVVRWLAALYFYRVPLVIATTLTLLWWARESAMVSGLYVADWRECFGLAFALTLLAGELFMLIVLLQLHGPKRLGMNLTKIALPRFLHPTRRLPSIVVSAIPLALNLYALYHANLPSPSRLSELAEKKNVSWANLTALAAGVALSAAIQFVIYVMNVAGKRSTGWQRVAVDRVVRAFPILFPPLMKGRHSRGISSARLHIAHFLRSVDVAEARFFLRLDDGVGFCERSRANGPARCRSGVLAATFLAAIVTLTYAIVAWISTSALFYVLLWLALAGWGFGLTCFWFDRYRVPFISVALIWSLGVSSLSRNAHYYFLAPNQNQAESATASDLFRGIEDRPGKRVVLVSAEGGGIHAAAWTARVLLAVAEKLEVRYPFLESIRLLSGTSGGSVGEMFFQALYGDPARLKNSGCWQAVIDASRNGQGLDFIAHSLVYHDVRRSVIPFAAYSPHDRGYSLEAAWKEMLEGMAAHGCSGADAAGATMHQLGAEAHAGVRPLLIFNTTVADSGWPMAITNFDLQQPDGFRVFERRYHQDIPLTTAVRLSASFPYVEPSPRPIGCDPKRLCFSNDIKDDMQLAVIDGGLYDDYGVAGAYQTLSQATNNFSTGSAPVLWIQIRCAPFHPGKEMDDKPILLSSTAAGPLFTLYRVRVTEQAAAAIALNQQAKLKYSGKLFILPIEFPFEAQPLSWKLTQLQADKVDFGWAKIADQILPKVACFFDDACLKKM